MNIGAFWPNYTKDCKWSCPVIFDFNSDSEKTLVKIISENWNLSPILRLCKTYHTSRHTYVLFHFLIFVTYQLKNLPTIFYQHGDLQNWPVGSQSTYKVLYASMLDHDKFLIEANRRRDDNSDDNNVVHISFCLLCDHK